MFVSKRNIPLAFGSVTIIAAVLAAYFLLRRDNFETGYPTFASKDGTVTRLQQSPQGPVYTVEFVSHDPDMPVMPGYIQITGFMNRYRLRYDSRTPPEVNSSFSTKKLGRIQGLKVGSKVMVHVLKKSSDDRSDVVIGVSSKPLSVNYFDSRQLETMVRM
jgi:hypothetical protein